ncbi:hypothetical protein [Gallaecimonas mangrovi]|uniref:hypothetical protein n=1 Tax=Gallaecimonas mangrovi TaxID=2291597 RepID=UPI001260313D|nr:hypothetical protein [Gallaecimonas mangrovi]
MSIELDAENISKKIIDRLLSQKSLSEAHGKAAQASYINDLIDCHSSKSRRTLKDLKIRLEEELKHIFLGLEHLGFGLEKISRESRKESSTDALYAARQALLEFDKDDPNLDFSACRIKESLSKGMRSMNVQRDEWLEISHHYLKSKDEKYLLALKIKTCQIFHLLKESSPRQSENKLIKSLNAMCAALLREASLRKEEFSCKPKKSHVDKFTKLVLMEVYSAKGSMIGEDSIDRKYRRYITVQEERNNRGTTSSASITLLLGDKKHVAPPPCAYLDVTLSALKNLSKIEFVQKRKALCGQHCPYETTRDKPNENGTSTNTNANPKGSM